MNRVFVSILLFLTVACTGKSPQEKSAQKVETPLQNTSIEFTELSHGFGELKAGEIVLHTFEFENTGSHDFVIESIETDCGCVHTNHIQERVKPGEKGWIEVELDTSGLVGREYKTIEIHGNSKELKHLAIFATVKNELLDIKY
ncbi:DUF1573 domain-containing protein [Maribellus sediminis]|uniref:DUF1573 domain-containing protein n=1 Tax=Maribellus sediminis TaxID=2696285 RepID=UPI0014317B28|nr:DUF1573 domain-containing protein [Maribellus sediminis]